MSDVRARVHARCAHLQDGVFGKVGAVDGVLHFVFAVERSQCVGPEVPSDFLLGERERERRLINAT